MNSLKNLLIIAALAGVGYVVYVSLACNNADTSPPPGVAAESPGMPKVEFSGIATSPQPGGPLPLGTGISRPDTASGLGAGGVATPFASPSAGVSPLAGVSSNSVPGASPAVTSAMPYNSSTSPSSPMAALGSPVPSDAMPGMTPASPAMPPNQTMPADIQRSALPPIDAAASNAAPPAATPADRLLQNKFTAFMETVQKYLDEGKLAEAHAALSMLYDNPDLPADQAKQINDLLNQLAGTVIYSRKHYLEPAYFAQPGDTLEKVAQRYSVPWQLLARINGLLPPGGDVSDDSATKGQPLPAGMELKVVRGPFEAVVHLDRHELTLMVQKRYAGRFPIGTGRDEPKLDGEYVIREKMPNPTYCGPDGVNLGPNDPKNPLGPAWIGLGDRIGIHGANNPQAIGRDDNQGAICVGNRDLQDLYGILSVGSRVTIVR